MEPTPGQRLKLNRCAIFRLAAGLPESVTPAQWVGLNYAENVTAMATETLAKTLRKAGVAHDIPWADNVKVTLPGDYLPFQHQYEGINLGCYYDRSGLFDEAGTGKTLALQASALFYVGCGNKVVVLTTPTLLKQFYEDMHKTFVGFADYVTMEIFRGTPAQRTKLEERYALAGWPDILLMTYDLFRGSKKKQPPGEDGKKKRVNVNAIGYHERLKKLGYSMLICDEAHCLRNSSSAIHKRVHRFIGYDKVDKQEAGIILSTATPAHTHVEQCYGLIRLKTPHCYGSKANFERLHVVKNYKSPFKEVIGYENLDVLAMNLYSQARRVEKKDVAQDMPPKIHTVIPVDLEPAHYKLYKKVLDERLLELEDGMLDLTQDSKLRQVALQVATNPQKYSDTPIRNNVLDTLKEKLENIDLDLTKVLIFSHFNAVADMLRVELAEYNPAVLNGTVHNKDLPKEAFLYDDTCRILIAHPKSAGAGLNFQSVCSNTIFYECPDSPGDLAQAEDRIHRIVGTKVPVNIYFLSPQKTWAAKKIKQVVDKDANINIVVGDKSALLSDLFD